MRKKRERIVKTDKKREVEGESADEEEVKSNWSNSSD